MKPLIPAKRPTNRRSKLRRLNTRMTADERELLAAVRLAQADYIRRFPEPAPSSAERKSRAAAVKALFAAWNDEDRQNPPSPAECESYDRMLERMNRERAG
ncbi:MAG: hypothetical protein KA788_06315 [Lacunisphaera sp.]|nr:hypothetical protein [Lacunisphaera sp.]